MTTLPAAGFDTAQDLFAGAWTKSLAMHDGSSRALRRQIASIVVARRPQARPGTEKIGLSSVPARKSWVSRPLGDLPTGPSKRDLTRVKLHLASLSPGAINREE
jgi:hypothetical protein